MDSDEEILSSYSTLTLTSRTETTISTRDSASNAVVEEHEEVFEDASSDISILTKPRGNSTIHLDRSKMRKAVHHELCTHTQNVFEPLFLRRCEMQRVRQGTAPPNIIPIQKTEIMEAHKKSTGHSALLVSLDAPTFCVRYLASNVVHKPKNVLVYTSPICFVRFVARPDPQKTNGQSIFEDTSQEVHLMMPPDEAIVAKKMLPKWQTVTFTLAFGKHVAVKYRIIEVRKQSVTHVKARLERVKRVSTSTLYRTEPIQSTVYWRSFKANELKLSTVEKNDPQMVKRVLFEQQNNGGGGGATWNSEVVEKEKMDKEPQKIKKSKTIKTMTMEELNLRWQRSDFN